MVDAEGRRGGDGLGGCGEVRGAGSCEPRRRVCTSFGVCAGV